MTPEERQQVIDFIGDKVELITDDNVVYLRRQPSNLTMLRLIILSKDDMIVPEYICEAINEKLSRDRAETNLKSHE